MAKLVDILAKRLLAWPEMAVIAVQDADGELKFSEDSSAHIDIPEKVWIRGAVLGFREDGRIGEVADDYRTAIVTRAEWQAAVEALKPDAQRFAEDYVEANKDRHVKEWDGIGEPPSGTVCELRHLSAQTDWGKATIAFASRNVIVWDWDGEPALNGLCTAYRHAVEVRPIRTPEQIAAEERSKSIAEIIKLIGWEFGMPGSDEAAARIYDAGYRKQEPK